jgi:hypothetical protein
MRGRPLFRIRRFSIGVLAGMILLCASAAQAQDWAKKMFSGLSHDFGTVARGAKAEYRFTIENIYEEEVHIQSVMSSCGCTKPKATKQVLKTWEKAEIVVALDTKSFLGRKDTVVAVTFDQPFPAEVQIHIHAYIRSDIVVKPGLVQFGTVAQGAGAVQNLAVNYAGRDDWKILKVDCTNPNIEAGFVETGRGSGQIGYNLSVKLKKEAPSGYLQDQIVLVTNDANTRVSKVPIAVEGLVSSAITIRPSPLSFGLVEAGKPVTRNLVLQGRSPFHILAATTSDDRFQCKIPKDARTVHILPVTFLDKGGNAPGGALSAKIQLRTDLAGAESVEAGVMVQNPSEAMP